MHNLWVDGKSLKSFGIYVSGEKTFGAPEWDYEAITVPGRNGDLLISQNRLKNIAVEYPAFIRKNFAANAQAARAYLLGAGAKYRRIEDDYSPDSYRMGVFAGPIDFDMRFLNLSGETNLVFNCKPQRWIKTGAIPVIFTSTGTLVNSWFPALPLIRVNGAGAGKLYVGGYTVEIKNLDDYLIVDSETQNAYKGTENKNGTISVQEFPVLQPGETSVSWDGQITSVEITPRWWTV